MKKQLLKLLIRWLANSLGIWVAANLIDSISYGGEVRVLIIAGLILALVNNVIKPLVVILSLPFIIFTLGLFVVVINGFMVWLASQFYPSLEIESFVSAILAGLVIGLVNYIVTVTLEELKDDHEKLI